MTQTPEYGIDEALQEAAKKLAASPDGAPEEIDRIIREVGPHHVAHFLTMESEAAQALRAYLKRYWPAYLEFIDRLIHAARHSENEDVQSDFGEA